MSVANFRIIKFNIIEHESQNLYHFMRVGATALYFFFALHIFEQKTNIVKMNIWSNKRKQNSKKKSVSGLNEQ